MAAAGAEIVAAGAETVAAVAADAAAVAAAKLPPHRKESKPGSGVNAPLPGCFLCCGSA